MKRGHPTLHGLMAEFRAPTEIVVAAREAHAAGYRKMDAYTPFPIEELAEALGYRSRGRLPKIVLAGGLFGCVGGFLLQYWCAVVAYPVNVGGRPLNSWPSFIPITFEMMVLTASLSGLFGLIALCGLPRPNHPLFNNKIFDRATRDRFFLSVEATDPKFEPAATKAFLQGLNPSSPVEEVYE